MKITEFPLARGRIVRNLAQPYSEFYTAEYQNPLAKPANLRPSPGKPAAGASSCPSRIHLVIKDYPPSK